MVQESGLGNVCRVGDVGQGGAGIPVLSEENHGFIEDACSLVLAARSGAPGPRRLAGAAWGEVGVLTVFMAASWHLPVRELQGRKALIGIIRSSVTSMCPARDVGDDKISVVALLTSPYQHRDPQPCGLLRLLGSPPLPSLHWTSRSSCEDAQVRVAAALMSRFHNICVNLVSGSNNRQRAARRRRHAHPRGRGLHRHPGIRTQPPDANRPHTRQLSTFILRYQPKVASEKMSTSRGRM